MSKLTRPLENRSMPIRSLIILLCFALLAGCGSTNYEAQFEHSLTHLRNEEPFRSLWPEPISIRLPGEESNEVLHLRVPRLFDMQSGEAYALDKNTLDPRDPKEAVAPERLWPEFLQIGEHLRPYERTLNVNPPLEGENRVPVRCYIAVADEKTAGSFGAIEKTLEERFRRPETAVADDDIKNPVGEEIKWKQIDIRTPDGGDSLKAARGEEDLALPLSWYEKLGKPKLKQKTIKSSCLIYLIPEGEKTVILAWLMPAGLAERENIESSTQAPPPKQYPIARAMAGTVKILEAGGGPSRDMTAEPN